MPHLQVRLAEDALDAAAAERVIAELTDAIVEVYGEWVRPHAVVEIIGVPPGRWGRGGVPAAPAPAITLSTRERVLGPPDGDARAARLIELLTAAVGRAVDPGAAERCTVELSGVPAGRSGVGGVPV
jgi:phenylpyruvate tautomerase PptA (4-oxalocrotonate tautomerase family)